MPPKRKRAEDSTAAEGSMRSTRKSTRTTARTTSGANDVAEETSVSNTSAVPPPKKSKSTSKKNAAATNKTRGTKGAPQVSRIDDEPLNFTTSQHDELDSEKPASSTTKEEYSQQRAQALFNRFADQDDPDVIGPGGVERLCTEGGIPLEGAQPLILAWQFKAEEMAKLSRPEWLQGTDALQISSLSVLALALKELDDLVVHDKEPIAPASSFKKRDPIDPREPYDRTRYRRSALDRNAAFAELYQFCFALAKPSQSRNLDLETAVALWSVLLVPRHPIVIELIEFLNESGSYKSTNKDIWKMVHEFCRTINPELTNYEADGAWPTMLDDFVGWKRNKMACSTDAVAAKD